MGAGFKQGRIATQMMERGSPAISRTGSPPTRGQGRSARCPAACTSYGACSATLKRPRTRRLRGNHSFMTANKETSSPGLRVLDSFPALLEAQRIPRWTS